MSFVKLTRVVRVSSYDEDGEDVSEHTTPILLNLEEVRCFYPRKNNQPGTRITCRNGAGYAVTEPYEEVERLVLGGSTRW